MRRKPAILLSLLLLLLIGGGAVAFYLHLRERAAPEFSEVMSSLSDSSSAIGDGWELTGYESFAFNIVNRARWLTFLGFEEQVVKMEDTFLFTHQPTGDTAEMIIHREGDRIHKVTFSGKTPAAATSLKQTIFRKFPQLSRRDET